MFGTSLEKVCRKIDTLVDELEAIDHRITHHEEQFDTARRLGIAQFGDDEVIQLWRRVQAQLIENLPKVKAKILSGEEDYKQVNRALKFTKDQVRDLKAAVAQADRDEAAGRKTAQDRLGKFR